MQIRKIYLILFLPILFTTCKSRKHALKGQPGEIVQPAASISSKYAEMMGVEENQISNGRLYTF
ncbi:MAG: glycoside hydrolase, partial [Sphingobacteriaceae bacterium]